jgi:hypothetical protein
MDAGRDRSAKYTCCSDMPRTDMAWPENADLSPHYYMANHGNVNWENTDKH